MGTDRVLGGIQRRVLRAGLPIDAPGPDAAAQASPPRAPEPRLGVRATALWAFLISRIYEAFPLACPKCGNEVRLIPRRGRLKLLFSFYKQVTVTKQRDDEPIDERLLADDARAKRRSEERAEAR